MKTVDLVKLEGAVISLQDAQSHLPDLVRMHRGHFCEKVDPAGIAPIQNNEAAVG